MFSIIIDEKAPAENDEETEEEMGKIKYQHTKQYSGILEYRKDDEPVLIKRLILGNSRSLLFPLATFTSFSSLPCRVQGKSNDGSFSPRHFTDAPSVWDTIDKPFYQAFN